jgi:ribose-phosphate pyrophosphokinase
VTTMATSPPAQHWFERLDFAPKPRPEVLARTLEWWQEKREGSTAPRYEDLCLKELAGAEPQAFVFKRRKDAHDYSLMAGESAIEPLLGSCERGSGLADAPRTRAAVRLRRLFDAVCQASEPVLAEFRLSKAGQHEMVVEIVAAPLASDQGKAEAVIGALSMRRAAGSAHRFLYKRTPMAAGPLLFALRGSETLGEAIARHLGDPLADHEERDFEDGEHKARPLVSVRNRDVYVVHSLSGDDDQSVNDKLCRLLFFIGGLKTAAADRVTAVVPYLCYARKDRQTKPRDPVTTRYVAQLFESIGTDRLITVEAHNVAALQNAFRCHTDHLDATALFARYFAREIGDAPVAVVSPDLGGAKRAEAFREHLESTLGRPIAKGFMDKQRSMGQVTGEIFAGDVESRHVIIIDDLISTGSTMARVAAASRAHGASRVYLAATHGVFTAAASTAMQDPAIAKIVVTDTVSQNRPGGISIGERLVVLSVAELLAEAIHRCHFGRSIGDLVPDHEWAGPRERASSFREPAREGDPSAWSSSSEG